VDIPDIPNSHRCAMTKKDAVTKLTMLKLEYGYNKIPTTAEVDVTDFEMIRTIAELAQNKYLTYTHDVVTDDEGIGIHVDRGYVFTPKALTLLRNVK
jgi:hypothetical protein